MAIRKLGLPLSRDWNKRAVSRNTQLVSSRTKPVCSANGMKSNGGTRPRSGCCQRTSASAATTLLVASAILGCKNRRSSPWATAWRSSDSIDKVWVLAESKDGSYTCISVVRALAAYMATSARDNKASTSCACCGKQAIPMLALMSTF